MARQVINLGIVPGDKKGDKLRVGGQKINDNFQELYASLSALSSSPILMGTHYLTESDCNQLTTKHIIIAAPVPNTKVVELLSMVAKISPLAAPIGGLQVAPGQTLNVTMDGDTETQDFGYFPTSFVTSSTSKVQRMTPTVGTQIYPGNSVYVCLSGGENPKSGSAHIELFFLYRIIDLSATGLPAGGGNADNSQNIVSFTNQTEIQVDHNLNKYPSVIVIDTAGRELVAEIIHQSTESMLIRLNPAASGKIIYY